MQGDLDYVLWFTLAWSGVVFVMVAAAVGVFLYVRRQSRTEAGPRHKSQVSSHKSDA